MARTAKKKIVIKDEGVIIADDADSIDFVGDGVSGVSILEAVTETISGSGTSLVAYAEVPSGTVDGVNKIFTLTHTPATSSNVLIALQGITQNNGTDFTVSGTTVTFAVAPSVGMGVFAYYNIFSSATGPVSRVAVSGTVNGSNVNFTLASVPITGLLYLSLGRQEQIEGVDFTRVGAAITYLTAPASDLAGSPHYAIIY